MLKMDWMKDGIDSPGMLDEARLSLNADTLKGLQEHNGMEHKRSSCVTLHGTTESTDMNGMTDPVPNWLSSAMDYEAAFESGSRNTSYDSEEIVFRGRAVDLDAIDIVKVSDRFEKLSVAEERNESIGESGGCSLDIEFPDLLDDDGTKDCQNGESVSASEDVRHRISSKFWISYWEELKAKRLDPYPGIDLNKGWNRHIYRGLREYFSNINSSLPPSTDILADFAAFSLRAQQLLIPVSPNIAQYFHYVFSSTGPVNSPFHTCHSRVLRRPRLLNLPAVMTASRQLSPYIAPDDILTSAYDMSYTDARTIYIFDCPPPTIRNICLWTSHGSRGKSREKRRYDPEESLDNTQTCWPEKRHCFSLSSRRVVDVDMADSDLQHCDGRQCHEMVVCDDQWRKRMRYRALTGGRWTDGTLRQDKMWAAFHWVLDGDVHDDPTKQTRAFEEITYG